MDLAIIGEILFDAVIDTAYLIPFLFVTYLAMEWLEHAAGARTQQAIRKAGAAGPILGALLGVVPQCGFSAAAATLYAGRVVTIGTLLAVFLSTSDEMLPIFIADQVAAPTILAILGAKVIVAVIVGYGADLVFRAYRRGRGRAVDENLRIHELCERDDCHCDNDCATCKNNPALAYEHHDDCAPGCDHDHHEHDHSRDPHAAVSILKSALIHTAQVTLFVFLITLALDAVLAFVGEESLAEFVGANAEASIFAAALVGLIPNCAASVAVAQLFVDGILTPAAMFAGLLTGAGVGLLVLFRNNRPVSQNVGIVVALYIVGVIAGFIVQAAGVTF